MRIVAAHIGAQSPHVIEDVFVDIDDNDVSRAEYASQVNILGKMVVNQAIGRYVRDAVNGVAIRQVAATRAMLTGNY
jgi:hypothetical protein